MWGLVRYGGSRRRRPAVEAVCLAALGQQLVTTLVLPFEVISLVFVVAMVGAIALAAPRPPTKNFGGGTRT